MSTEIATVAVAAEQDVVYARQRARLIAELLGFDHTDQTRLSTAVSEIARNAFQYAGGGEVTFLLEGEVPPQLLAVTVRDDGPGILDIEAVLGGTYDSHTGMGLGIIGTRRLMDHFYIDAAPTKGTTVFFGKTIPAAAGPVTPETLGRVADALVKTRAESPLEEVRLQNQELLLAMDELRAKQEELLALNAELEDTNRGVLALYTELDEKATQLKRANELKARFLSDMSHEFRTPLNSIIALSRLLLDRVDGDLTSEQEKQVTFISEGAENLGALVNDLLDLAKIEAGKTIVRPRAFRVDEVLSGLRGMFKPLSAKNEVALTIGDADPSFPMLETDDGKISQILRNFLSNALKFTDRGEIRLGVTLSEDGASAVFAVRDTGVGIAEEDQQRIFEEYSQVEGTQRRRGKGTGLGLPISRRLAEMLGGSVSVTSEPGRGSTFTASIPLRYGPEAGADADAVVEDATRHPVLLVEDDDATQLLYEKYLRDSGFQVIAATTLEQARQALESVRPVAIILDLMMGEGDSWWFMADVKAAPATRDIPVIITSVLEEQAKGMAMGAEDYCVKPVERKWLLSKLSALSTDTEIRSVLIVDDEQVARYILRGHLAGTKYRIIEASGGQEGLLLAANRRPDVIFLDLMMPGMSGFETLHRLKQDPATAAIPVIISTSRILDQEEREELNNEALAILSKRAPSREAALGAVNDALQQAVRRAGQREGGEHGD